MRKYCHANCQIVEKQLKHLNFAHCILYFETASTRIVISIKQKKNLYYFMEIPLVIFYYLFIYLKVISHSIKIVEERNI